MLTSEGLRENFRFLVLEVTNQVAATGAFLESPTIEGFNKIVSRDDYIDNLKNIIENKCFSKIHRDGTLSRNQVNSIRASQIICVNLERIADFCVNIARQMEYLSDPAFIKRYDYKAMLETISQSLGQVLPVANTMDLAGALSICRSEFDLDRQYKTSFDHIMAELRTGLHVEALITVLFIFRYLERVGDSLLNIGEALIFAIIGEKIKIEQFQALQQTLSKTGYKGPITDIDFQSIWGTRSGCRIGKVSQKEEDADAAHGSIFKEGALQKIRREKENIESWNNIFPGLAPKVFSYHEEDDNASLLVEFLPGCTMDEIALTSDDEHLDSVFSIFEQTVIEIWENTLVDAPAKGGFIDQIRSRMDSILQLHPHYDRMCRNICGAGVLSSDDLLGACAEAEAELPAPFTVFLHGDFNANNIVYNDAKDRIHFIDLYRSGRGDYVQDASVLMVSFFRLPIFEEDMRARLCAATHRVYDFAQEFAARHKDATFQARMALALARNFFTSTRFETNEEFADDMCMRSQYLLEKVRRHKGAPWEDFRLPEAVLCY